MTDDREDFLNGVLAFKDAMRSCNLDVDAMTIVMSEDDGRKLEHILTQNNMMVLSADHDPRYSSPKADRHVREFRVAGVRMQYRPRLFKMPNGDVL